METEAKVIAVTELLSPWAKDTQTPAPNRADIYLDINDLLPVIRTLRQPAEGKPWGYLSAITGLDHKNSPVGDDQDGELEALYHFCSGQVVLTLRVSTPRQEAWLPSVCEIIPSASLYERELREMFGFNIINTPSTEKLFLPDDWPDGVYPMRKDFDPALLEQHKKTATTKSQSSEDSGDGRFVVNIGPQHPALKEPGHFSFAVDGEVVTGASIRLGYVHRGLEKAAEDRNWVQNLYLFERVCGICSHTHSYAYSLAVEQLAQIEIPARAQAIRELGAGLERIHSHLLWLGVAAHEAGFDTLFMYSWRDREIIMEILEGLTGNRVNYSLNVLGGVKVDLGNEQIQTLRKGMDTLEQRTRYYLDVVTTDAAFLQRTRGIGKMSMQQAEAWQVVGPTARASGLARDIRVEAPYGSYRRFPISIVTAEDGDLVARFEVRLKEVLVSIQAIRTILDNLPAGELSTRVPRRLPAGEAISRVEAPRGELFYFIKSNGGEKPERIKVRTPSICNFASVMQLAIGHQLADMPMILSGIDPCFSCNDR